MIKRFGKVQKLTVKEEGMALVTSLLILTALTGIAVTAMNNTTIETMISGNDLQSQKRIYSAEGMANLVFALLPDMLSTNNPNTGSDYTINDLLSWSYDGDMDNRGDLTSSSSGNNSALNTLLTLQNMSSFYDPEPGIAEYFVSIEDNRAEADNDLYTDSDEIVFLYVYRTDSNAITSKELAMEISPLDLLNHDGAVNLIDPNSDISFPTDPDLNYKIDAIGTGKYGMVTADNNALTSGLQDKVNPGINYDPNANPSSEEIRNFKEALIRYATPIKPPDAGFDNGNYTVTVDGSKKLTGVSYVQGNLELISTSGSSGILIIEEYNDRSNNDHMGLTLKGSDFNGLIIMFPENRDPNFENRVKIELKAHESTESSINGIIVAGSSSSQGIAFDIQNATEIIYDTTIAEGLLDNRFIMKDWSRREYEY